MNALETHGLVRTFGGFLATDNVSLSVRPGARHAIIGPNGAGKTTLINLLTGFLTPTEGRILLDGEDVTRLPQNKRVKRGLVRTFQINQLFARLTALESVCLALAEREGVAARWWKPVAAHHKLIDEGAELLESLGLLDVAAIETRSLPYGKQRLLEIALALALKPRVLLLDEPAAGVPRQDSRELFDTIARLPSDVTILLIEHDMELVFRFTDRISVLVSGAILVDGTPEEVARDPKVREVYLGESAHA
ncbi:ABC transporter ATP-binding protein [Lacibacterium aquatile]|uniref:ABC transporter ATP-binding protein n=1 Tax=Lacibacterium aquatile TaxID=1168082 RepID=A0ABW5DNC2_9PROT